MLLLLLHCYWTKIDHEIEADVVNAEKKIKVFYGHLGENVFDRKVPIVQVQVQTNFPLFRLKFCHLSVWRFYFYYMLGDNTPSRLGTYIYIMTYRVQNLNWDLNVFKTYRL